MEECVNTKFQLDCECGCRQLVFSHWSGDGDETYVLSYDLEFSGAGLWRTFKERISLAFKILAGKKYHVYDIVISEEKLVEMGQFIEKVTKKQEKA